MYAGLGSVDVVVVGIVDAGPGPVDVVVVGIVDAGQGPVDVVVVCIVDAGQGPVDVVVVGIMYAGPGPVDLVVVGIVDAGQRPAYPDYREHHLHRGHTLHLPPLNRRNSVREANTICICSKICWRKFHFHEMSCCSDSFEL